MASDNCEHSHQVDATPITPKSDLKQNIKDEVGSAMIPPIQESTFATTPALKAARTRAWKTFEGFSQEDAEALFPSNVFVRLKMSNEKARQSSVPVVKTKWEERLASPQVAATKVVSWETRFMSLGVSGPSTTQNFAGGKAGDVDRKGESEDKFGAGNAGLLTNQAGEPSLLRHTNQPPNNCTQAAALNLIPQLHSQSTEQTEFTVNPSSHEPPLDRQGLTADGTTEASDLHSSIYEQDLSKLKSFKLLKTAAIKSPAENKPQAIFTADNVVLSLRTPIKRNNIVTTTGRQVCKFVGHENEGLNKHNRPHSSPDSTAEIAVHRGLPPLGSANLSNTRSKTKSIEATSSQVNNTSTTETLATSQYPRDPNQHLPTHDMAPVRDQNSVDASLKDAIQKLYEVQSQVHGFMPQTQPLLVEKMTELAHSLAHLQTLTSLTLSPNNPIHKNRIAPEVIDYVDDSRNPDIYNREFVELVQRGNAVMNGKQQAFSDFSKTFAKALKQGMPELSDQVDGIMGTAGHTEKKTYTQTTSDEGTNGANQLDKTDARKEGELSANGARDV